MSSLYTHLVNAQKIARVSALVASSNVTCLPFYMYLCTLTIVLDVGCQADRQTDGRSGRKANREKDRFDPLCAHLNAFVC